MKYTYEKLRSAYPHAKICYCSPVQGAETVRPYSSIKAKGIVIKEICMRLSDVTFINTFLCGICGCYELKKPKRQRLD